MTELPESDYDKAVGALLSQLGAVLRAWTVPGPAPVVHEQAQARLRRDWPALAGALDATARMVDDEALTRYYRMRYAIGPNQATGHLAGEKAPPTERHHQP